MISHVFGSWFSALSLCPLGDWYVLLWGHWNCVYTGECAWTDGGLSILSCPALASALVHSVQTMAYHDVTVLRSGVYLVLLFCFSSRPSFSFDLLGSSLLFCHDASLTAKLIDAGRNLYSLPLLKGAYNICDIEQPSL